MRNYLIKLLGGVTSVEFAEVFALATKDREVMLELINNYRLTNEYQKERLRYVEDLIFKKVGYVLEPGVQESEIKDFQPIGGQNTWGKVKHQLELVDKKLMQERNNKHGK